MRQLFISTAALVVLSGTAMAQDPSRFFFDIEGAYWFDEAVETHHGIPGLTVSTTAGDGTGIRGLLGYRFGGAFDFAVGGAYNFLGEGAAVPDIAGGDTWHVGPVEWYYADAQLGYNFVVGGGAEARIAVGPRVGRFVLNVRDTFVGPPVVVNDVFEGIGVMGSLDARVPLGGSSWGLIFGGQGAFLFGELEEDASGAAAPTDQLIDRDIWGGTGYAGVDLRIDDTISMALGYRVEYWDSPFFDLIANPGLSEGDNEILVHGPFARASFGW